MSQASGFRSEGTGETRTLLSLQAGLGALFKHPGRMVTSPRGSRQREWVGRRLSQLSSSTSQPCWEHLRHPYLEAWSPSMGPQEAGRASTEGPSVYHFYFF